MTSGEASPNPPVRADVVRNRRRLLDATVELILQLGGEPTRDAIAARAGVGIGTLYRHFPDQQELLRAVVLDVLDRTIEQGRAVLEESATGGEALRRYMHAAVDTGLGVVNMVYPLLENTDWPDRRAAAQELLNQLIDMARHDGAIGSDVTVTDIALAIIRFCRPLAVGLDVVDDRATAHQHLETYLNGLEATGRAFAPNPERSSA